MDLLQIVIYALLAVIILSIVYRILPYRTVSEKKPKLAMFPKYVIPNSGTENCIKALKELDFKRCGESDVYVRGHYIGDFLASWTRLNVVVSAENVYVHSPLIVIFFDTGDLWEIASALSARNALD